MPKVSKPLVFLFPGTAQESGAHRFPGCVTFQIYMYGNGAQQAVMDWLQETCPNGYRFGHARVWRRGDRGRSYRCEVPVVHIMDRGVAAMFKMVFAKTEHERREYVRAKRRKAA